MVKIVCSPNSLEALKKRGGLNAKFVPLSVLGSFALQETKKEDKKKTAGENYFLINSDLKRKPQERNSQCCASEIQEKGKVCIEKCFFLCNPTEDNKEKRLSRHCLPIINFKNTEPIM